MALPGDAAHEIYPVGSNGTSQPTANARVLGAEIVAHGATSQALRAYDESL